MPLSAQNRLDHKDVAASGDQKAHRLYQNIVQYLGLIVSGLALWCNPFGAADVSFSSMIGQDNVGLTAARKKSASDIHLQIEKGFL